MSSRNVESAMPDDLTIGLDGAEKDLNRRPPPTAGAAPLSASISTGGVPPCTTDSEDDDMIVDDGGGGNKGDDCAVKGEDISTSLKEFPER